MSARKMSRDEIAWREDYQQELLRASRKARASAQARRDEEQICTEILEDKDRLDAIVKIARAMARYDALQQAARDVCMYCGGRALGFGEPLGPNGAGNWTHASARSTGRPVLCLASSIYSRMRYERAN